MPAREIIAVYSENNAKHIKSPIGQSAELINVKSGDVNNRHSAVTGYI
jgi:hypothetical protein